MRYVAGFALSMALAAWPLRVSAHEGESVAISKHANTGSLISGRGLLPPQLMLRAGYYLDLEAGANTDATSVLTEPSAEEPNRGQQDERSATTQEEALPSSAPGTDVPDIETLSQRAVEHFEIRHAQSRTKRGTGERSRAAKIGIAVGSILATGVVAFGIAAAVAVSTLDFSQP